MLEQAFHQENNQLSEQPPIFSLDEEVVKSSTSLFHLKGNMAAKYIVIPFKGT